jgi:hypothetical protein
MINLFSIACIFALFIFLSFRKPKYFISAVILHLTVLTSVFFDPGFSSFPNYITVLGGINVYFVDIYAIVALIASVLAIHTNPQKISPKIQRFNFNVMFLLVLTVFALYTWTISTSIEISVNFWRPYLLPLALLIYVSRLTNRYSFDDLLSMLIPIDVILLILLYFRVLTSGLGEVDTNPGALASTIRALNASGAFFLLSFIVLLINTNYKITSRKILIIANSIGLILTLQRTMIIAGICVLFYNSIKKSKYGGQTYLAPILYLIPLIGIFLSYTNIFAGSKFQEAGSTYTLEWRVAHWGERISIPRKFSEWIFGTVLGPNNLTDPAFFRLTSHNLFVDVLEFYGVVGVLIFAFLIYSRFHGPILDSKDLIPKELTIVFLIFSFSYTPTPLCFLIWGLIGTSEKKLAIQNKSP